MFRFIMCNKLYLQINCITIAHLSALSACLHGYLSLCRPVYPPACLFVYLFVCMISFKVLVLVLTYQALHGTAPQYMTDLLFRYQPTKSLRSSDALLLTAPQSRLTSFGDRAFQHAAPRLWNGLPISLRSANNLNSFKKTSKDISFQGCLQRVMCFTDTMDSTLA